MLRRVFIHGAVLGSMLLLGQAGRGDFKEVAPEYQRGNPQFLAAFRAAVQRPSTSTVRILCDGQEAALGFVVGSEGWIVTKANDLHGTIHCRLRDGRTFEAKIVRTNTAHDLAILKVAARGLVPVEFKNSKGAGVGNWVICAGQGDEPLAIGIVSVATRSVQPRGSGNDHDYLGVAVERVEGIMRITQVVPDTPASRAGLSVQDIMLTLQGQPIGSTDVFVDLMQKQKIGDTVTVRIKRGSEEYQMQATLGRRPNNTRGDFQNRLGSELSSRTTGYSVILQHDAVLRPRDCGGPLVDLDGKVIGINICRAGRTESWAIPAEVVQSVLVELTTGNMSYPVSPMPMKRR